ncbi:NAD(P)/FAD-dependent oxidoreductase [Halosegnis marinus]|uniref:NAD(P)/FAD-dependent oxidoreductase n=1 Tax=Halosegnis marinus TaxID=3034023 RepID=A0ABD5ZN34_9EURY|nr:FAD-dependent oxidoreductase [Halosegnis sp. DT85]
MRVVVCGGGIVGLSAAHALAERGVGVVVCEAGSLGAGNTERSAGGIRTQFSTRVNVDLSLASLPVWETFEERFGVDIAFRRPGYLFLARDGASAADLRDAVAVQRDAGAETELLTPDEAHEHCPELRAERYELASYAATDGFADPHLALQGYATAAREAGVDIRTNTPVTNLEVAGGAADRTADVTVTTPDGRIGCDVLVNAAGAWAARVGAMAGVDLPVAARRRQVAVVDPETPVPESVPLTIDLDSGSYFRPEREGRALVGGHFGGEAAASDPDVDPDTYATGMDTDWAVTACERAGETAGYFGPETRIRRGWAGCYAVTPDHHPVVEVSRPGVVTAAGFSGHGFQHAPATGRVVAELCLDGAATHVDVSGLGRDRFDGDTEAERHVA